MKHFINNVTNLSKQCVACALITDARGKEKGKIIIRFTQSQIGHNHEVGILFHPNKINFNKTYKGDTYSQPVTLIKAFNENGIKCLDFYKAVITDNGDSLSQFSDVKHLKIGNNLFNIIWVM